MKGGVSENPQCVMRPFPYPFRAMMSICSDLDETPDESVYRETVCFLNGTKDTSMGQGLGLEVGNTIYFDMPAGQFAYWNTSEDGREMIRTLVRSGHIDCIHSFGDLANIRSCAERALEELERHRCFAKVWVDHAVSPTNFGGDIMKGKGDVPGSLSYHADLTLAYGIRYICMGRVTSVVGQDVARRYDGIFNANHPFSSGKTLVKEAVKNLLAETLGGKYAMHAGNVILRNTTLRDGRNAIEFIRCNPHWGGVSVCDTADGLGKVLTSKMLDLLEEREGTCILYTHLGKIHDRHRPLCGEAIHALRTLAERYQEGRILLTTTRKLLDFANARRTLRFRSSRNGDWTQISLDQLPWGKEIGGVVPEGMTFYVDDPEKTRLIYGEEEILNLRKNPPDATSRRSVSIPWIPLRFPEIQNHNGDKA